MLGILQSYNKNTMDFTTWVVQTNVLITKSNLNTHLLSYK